MTHVDSVVFTGVQVNISVVMCSQEANYLGQDLQQLCYCLNDQDGVKLQHSGIDWIRPEPVFIKQQNKPW